jgi:hypothetical protein
MDCSPQACYEYGCCDPHIVNMSRILMLIYKSLLVIKEGMLSLHLLLSYEYCCNNWMKCPHTSGCKRVHTACSMLSWLSRVLPEGPVQEIKGQAEVSGHHRELPSSEEQPKNTQLQNMIPLPVTEIASWQNPMEEASWVCLTEQASPHESFPVYFKKVFCRNCHTLLISVTSRFCQILNEKIENEHSVVAVGLKWPRSASFRVKMLVYKWPYSIQISHLTLDPDNAICINAW